MQCSEHARDRAPAIALPALRRRGPALPAALPALRQALLATQLAGASRGALLSGSSGLPTRAGGYGAGMELSILLIIIGIVLAILVSWALGIIVILIGLALLLLPRLRGGASRV